MSRSPSLSVCVLARVSVATLDNVARQDVPVVARTLLTCLAVALASACSVAEAPEVVRADPAVVDAADRAPSTEPAGMPSIEETRVETLGGVVQEVQSAGHYTYVRIGAPGSEGDWAVVMGALDTAPGEVLTLSVQGSQHDFHSRRLDRDFEQLFFASVPSSA